DGSIDPGILGEGYASESLLDVEIAGGLAPGAQINYYYAASTDLADGLVLAALRALEDNKVNVLSVSYGECEADLGAGGNLTLSELWQEAAAQGITVTVSTGDSGSASCDSEGESQATRGLAVSGFASTPYNVAVGGTDFYVLPGNFGNYANTSTTGSYSSYYATALSYIPENPWNDSSIVVGNSFTQNTPYAPFGITDIVAGGGGISSQAVCNSGTNSEGDCYGSLTGYQQPPYQIGFQGQYPVRAIPDVSLLSANGFYSAAWIYCSDSTADDQGGFYTDCQLDSNGHLADGAQIGLIGGTSASAPAFAGMLAVISQSQGGARLGQADTVLYNLAQNYDPDPSNPGMYQRAFHDIAIGNNSVVCQSGTLDCDSTNDFLEGYNATPSYDMATGLGSIDLSQLISLWNDTTLVSTSNSLIAGTSYNSMSGAAISVTHGTPINFTTTVSPSDATGQFSIVSTNNQNAASFTDYSTIYGGTGYLTTSDLPGGSYTVYSYYAGDAGHIGSQSNGISVTISPESSTTTLSFGGYDPNTGIISEGLRTVPYGSGTYVSAQPFGNNSTVNWNGSLAADGIATGSVTFTSGTGSQSAAINSLGVAQLPISSLMPGTYTYQASYPGDASFAPSTSSPQTLTITKGATSIQLQPSATALNAVGQLTLTTILQTDSIALYPTGSVTAQANGHTYTPIFSTAGQSENAVANQLIFSISGADLAPGSNLITVSYTGDANYQPATATTSVTLVSQSGGTFTLSGPTQLFSVEASQQGSTTVSIVPANGFTGPVAMTCTVSAASSGHTPTCQASAATVYGSFGASSAVTAAAYADTPAGNYVITVVGTNGQQSQSVQIPLQVTTGPGFSLTAANSSLSIATLGQSASDKLTLSPIQGFTGSVTLTCAVAPTPSSGKAPACTLPSSLTLGSASENTTIQITSDSTTVPGSYTVAVTAVSGDIQQTVAVPLSVQQTPASPTFALSAATSTVSVAASGESVTDLLTLSPAGGFTGTVQLSCAVSGGSSSTATPTCTVPATASINGATVANATLTVSTTAPSAALAANKGRLFGERIGGLMLGCLLLFVVPRRRIWTVFGLLLLTAGAFAVTACGGGNGGTKAGGSPGTLAGSYTVTVTAVSGSINATTQVNVTVQ
ncbi:MAG TPA: Ig-like domain repeat protein, partial [Terracidiphilus sp.]